MRNLNLALISLLLLVTTSPAAHGKTFIQGPALVEGFTSITSAAGTTALTKDSETKQIVTGTTTQTITLPSATTIPLGRKFLVISSTTGNVTVNDNSGALLTVILPGSSAEFHLRVAGGAAGTWDVVNNGIGTSAIIERWQSYAPTLTGFGTATSVEFQWRQVGSNIEISGKFTSGTPTAVEARISLPTGLTSANTSTIPSIQLVGYGHRNTAATNQYGILIEPSVTYMTIDLQGTGSGLAKGNGDAILSSGNIFSFFASVPVAELSNTGTAFKIDCGVTGTCVNDFSFTFNSSGVVSNESIDFINGNCSGGAGVENYSWTCNFNSSFFSVAPNCVAQILAAAYPSQGRVSGVSTSNVQLSTSTGSGSPTAYGMSVVCQRVGADRRPAINAPLINNSVTSSSNGLERSERAKVSISNTAAAIVSQSGSWLSVSNGASAGRTNITLSGFSAEPACTCTTNETLKACSASLSSSTSGTLFGWNALTNAEENVVVYLHCQGPR